MSLWYGVSLTLLLSSYGVLSSLSPTHLPSRVRKNWRAYPVRTHTMHSQNLTLPPLKPIKLGEPGMDKAGHTHSIKPMMTQGAQGKKGGRRRSCSKKDSKKSFLTGPIGILAGLVALLLAASVAQASTSQLRGAMTSYKNFVFADSLIPSLAHVLPPSQPPSRKTPFRSLPGNV